MREMILILFILLNISASFAEDPWSFIVLADWHGSETFAALPPDHQWYVNAYTRHIQTLKHIKENYGGDLALIPGDTNTGKWHTQEFFEKLAKNMGGEDSEEISTLTKVVRQASHNCYSTMREIFLKGGYEKFLVAMGDHELGGNGWLPGSRKNQALGAFRSGFEEALNRETDGTKAFLYKDQIGNAPPRPLGTLYQNTSYAYRHKNVLFVTVDVFYNTEEDFIDRENGLGGEGSITIRVQGKHLEWFEHVLSQARNDERIKHIVVQAHIPILQPVRKVNSSGQFVDHGENSEFMKTMEKYGVDLYLAGEVHATTASKDPNSNLLQIASRGNQFNNFLSIEVTDDKISVKAFNEQGPLRKANNNYVLYGEVTIDKRSNSTVEFESSGALELLNPNLALVRYNFESMVPIQSRQVIGMKHDNWKEFLIGKQITIDGVVSRDAIPNIGAFGQQYDAQAANIRLVNDSRHGYYAARFNASSKVGVYAVGPHGGGNTISYAMWIKTSQKNSEMVLVHYGKVWGNSSIDDKDIHTLTLKNGNPIFYTNLETKVKPLSNLTLNDNVWHHIAISMPRKSCLASEIKMYVDGNLTKTQGPKIDNNIFHITSGRISLGGLGYSAEIYKDIMPQLSPYVGLMDEFMVFARPLKNYDFQWMLARNFDVSYGWSCDKRSLEYKTFPGVGYKTCSIKCSNKNWCKGYEWTYLSGKKQCILLRATPKKGEKLGFPNRCVVLLD